MIDKSNIEPLSTIDAAWLRMEDPTNLMMVSGVLTFKEPLDIHRLRDVIENRLLNFDRFRKRVVQPNIPFASAYWEYDPNFDLDAHLHHIALPKPGDKAALQQMSSELMSIPLDFSKPLWMIHLIDNYEGGAAVFVRLHHCIADGMALVFVLLSLTDLTPDASNRPPKDKPQQPASRRGFLGGVVTVFGKQSRKVVSAGLGFTSKVVHHSVQILREPTHIWDIAQFGGENAFATARLVLRGNDPLTLFKGKLGVSKRAAWSQSLPLKDVKAIKKVTGTTVNDVLVAAMAGGLRRYLQQNGQEVNGLNFRAAVPVNLRTPEEMGTLGNKFGLLFLTLPIGVADPLERLNEVHNNMQALKNSKEGPVGLAILSSMGVTPTEFHSILLEMFGAKLTAVMTNVPGPPMPLYMAGERIDNIMFWVPQSGRVGLGISIISYAGKVYLGVATDAGLVPDPERIIDGFYTEFAELLSLAKEAEAVAAEDTKQTESKAAVEAAPAQPTAEDDVSLPSPNNGDLDLQHINGIGPIFATRLVAADIHSEADLKAKSADQLAGILKISPARAANILAEV
ncbi:MAG: wax ester/triacylglycerol synthase family O-acyltransferase [Chloroflexi bacterium]|nr:wax ester/triacylglycerol synthase family O-acyltransferase [Chloroflexota bacterium]